ncbi:MAG: hypothetical protein KatS3mg038_0999 [Candidatus Kapaibacterium sp.]|nr:MAG: hypothetical protein KatS3mg038_0999 [Candidatus Kapabacteria bacterium]
MGLTLLSRALIRAKQQGIVRDAANYLAIALRYSLAAFAGRHTHSGFKSFAGSRAEHRMTLYFIYSIDDLHRLDDGAAEPIAAPYSIAWNVARRLRHIARAKGVSFEYRNLDDTRPLELKAGDLVIGHPWWAVERAPMNEALTRDTLGVRKAILMPFTPFVTDNPQTLCTFFENAEKLFLIQGRYWYDQVFVGSQFPLYRKYVQKVTRIDMAITPRLHPHLKRVWGAPGKRGVLFIGHDAPCKGLDYAIRIAGALGVKVGHCGSG